MRYHLTLVRIGLIKKFTKTKFWRVCGEKGPLILLVGMLIDTATMEDGAEILLKKTSNKTTI